jgi:hypothetical protein
VAEAVNRDRDAQLATAAPAQPVRWRRALSGSGSFALRALRTPRRLGLSRVGAAYLLLALAIGGAAAGIALALSGSGKSKAAVPVAASSSWSTWRPSGIGSTAVRQIAAQVAKQYRLPGGKQLVNVIAHSPALASGLQVYAISAIEVEPDTKAVRLGADAPSRSGESAASQATVFGVGEGVMYILCGSATDCSIGRGKPSAARGALVRREALELALYTFKYVPGTQTVLAFVPPPPGLSNPPKKFIVLRREDVGSYLDRPLPQTIGPSRRITPKDLSGKEKSFVDAATVSHLFELNQTQQLPDGTLALLLAPETLPPL